MIKMLKYSTFFVAVFSLSSFCLAQTKANSGIVKYIQLTTYQNESKNQLASSFIAKPLSFRIVLKFIGEKFMIYHEKETSINKNYTNAEPIFPQKEFINLNAKTFYTEYTVDNFKKYHTEERIEAKSKIQYLSETKNILGYQCNKAIVSCNDQKYSVWYTTKIPRAYSPLVLLFNGINGTVLEYTSKNTTCKAISVNIQSINSKEISLDKNSMKVTPKQVEDLEEEAYEKYANSLNKK